MPTILSPKERRKNAQFSWIGGFVCIAIIACFITEGMRIRNDTVKYVNGGHALYAQGDYKGAIADYRAFLKKYPNHRYVRADLAEAYLQLGMKAEARDQYRAAIYGFGGRGSEEDKTQWQAKIDAIDKSK